MRPLKVQVNRAGRVWEGTFQIHHGQVHVESAYGSASSPLRGGFVNVPQARAELVLGEIVERWLRKQHPGRGEPERR